ncbi:rhomboid family intramembrane serine protease [Aeoliella mucimassa]|uniref:Rhomboid family protein n=1 Tax=Aeoliella mucimassa TaxID=2527972 RepID=A0A518AWA7_9BACT|nr:rhomboid family intramembrane serine protease [Aeoliella mucimassa]QDU59025.1 Rhomboid family protein [Aeoliella mucimassa]
MLLPISTDAPVYHWPYATIGLIVANVLAFPLFHSLIATIGGDTTDPADAEHAAQLLYWLILVHGDLNPVQWVTSLFMHGGFMHLLTNMVFLWVFGLIVEGKVGWARFLGLYLGIGVLQSAFTQFATLASTNDNVSIGASSAIAGLMAISLIWAPRNNIDCLYWFGFFMGTTEIAVFVLALIYATIDLLFLAIEIVTTGDIIGGLLHPMGTVLGAIVGIVMVKMKLVDCEGFDLFHAWNGADPNAEVDYKEVDARVAIKKEERATQQRRDAHQQIREYLEEDNVRGAATLYQKLKQHGTHVELDREELIALVKGLHERKEWALSAPLMYEWVARFPQGTDNVRLKLAQICVTALEKPARALEILQSLDSSQLPPEKQAMARKIVAKAHQLQAEGVYELDDESW